MSRTLIVVAGLLLAGVGCEAIASAGPRFDWPGHAGQADEAGFAMPVRVGAKDRWQIIQPTTAWKTMKTSLKRSEFSVATDLYYVNVAGL